MEENKGNSESTPLVHDFNTSRRGSFLTPKIIGAFVIIVLLGIGSGYFLSTRGSSVGGGKTVSAGNILNSNSVPKGTVIGSNDTTTFKDTAEGVLQQGGIDGEGAYHLVRSGGPSQYVYLTSSIVDLSKFTGQKIKVWGQTQKAQHAGWLMDVGRVEVE